MNRPLSYTIIFLFLALFSLIGLQAYFSFNDFQVKQFEFKQSINESFTMAVALEREERKNIVLDSFRAILLDTTRIRVSASIDSTEMKTVYSIQDAQSEEKYTSITFQSDPKLLNELNRENLLAAIDRIVKAAGDYLDDNAIYFWTNALGEEMIELTDATVVDTNRLRTIYDSLLQQDQVYSDYQFGLLASMEKDSFPSTPKNQWQTETLPTDLYSDQWEVFAYFKRPFQDIFRKAWLSISGSLFIVLITGLTFFMLFRTIVKQKKLAEIKADFLDNISHELQTPIATLRAANEGMEKYGVLKEPEKAAKYIQIQKQAIARLSKMVDDLLRNSIYKRAPQSMHLSPVNYQEIIQLVMDRYKLKSGKIISFKLQNSYPSKQIKTDRFTFESICDNLIGNAIKHHPKAHLEIEILMNKSAGDFQLIISDDGLGIPSDQREKVFERFYQLSTQLDGHGLGLAYVKDLVNRLDGKISISESKKGGAQFIIQLPQEHG